MEELKHEIEEMKKLLGAFIVDYDKRMFAIYKKLDMLEGSDSPNVFSDSIYNAAEKKKKV